MNKLTISLITSAMLVNLALASDDLKENKKIGANMAIIHEYGSKIIFGNGKIEDRKGVKNATINEKFREKSGFAYREFIKSPSDNVSPVMITSIYFTGEGIMKNGGIYSPNFKNKMNINNLLGFCLNANTAGSCRSALNLFDITNAVYFAVYDNKSMARDYDFEKFSSIKRDKARWNRVKTTITNEAATSYDKEVTLKKLEQLESFLTIAWASTPHKYKDYVSGEFAPYLLNGWSKNVDKTQINPNQIFLAGNTNYIGVIPGFYGNLPSYFRSNLEGSASYGGNTSIPNIDANGVMTTYTLVDRGRQKRRRGGGFRRQRYEIVPYTFDLMNKEASFLRFAQNIGGYATNVWGAIYPAYTGTVGSGVEGGAQIGANYNRNTYSIIMGNYLIAAKNGFVTSDLYNNWVTSKNAMFSSTPADPSKTIASELVKGYVNNVKIIERHYGLSPVINKIGNTDIKTYSDFSVINEYYNIENFFDKNAKNSAAYVARFKEYLNFNGEEGVNPPQTYKFPIEHNAESIYHLYDQATKRFVKVVGWGKHEGGNYSIEIKLDRKFNFMGYNMSGQSDPSALTAAQQYYATPGSENSAWIVDSDGNSYPININGANGLNELTKKMENQNYSAPSGTSRWIPTIAE